ncbi:TRAP transporter large permease subunit, partial [uncultured Sulfitobacter sp.]|uniref:TRAP transporter large permease subunit n=1 Tax=uncultured Sulfitobacter sp. TaxID=191468 RepID=UPI0025940033
MDPSLAPYIAVALIILLMAFGAPVFAALALSGAVGIVLVEDFAFLMTRLKSISYSTTAVYTLTIIPLFILMGSFAHHAQVGKKLFDVASRWVGHLPGGLAMAAILTSAGFAATSGSSVATAATVGSVAIPEMKKAGYQGSLSAGAVVPTRFRLAGLTIAASETGRQRSRRTPSLQTAIPRSTSKAVRGSISP